MLVMATEVPHRQPKPQPHPNRCDYCGRFRAWGDMRSDFTPDTAFTSEQIVFVCKGCDKETP